MPLTYSERNNKELQKRYDSLLKDHERLAQAFRNQEKETKLLGQQLEEKEKEYEEAANDAEELANLVRTKCKARVSDFITSTLKSLAIRAIWLTLSSVIFSQITSFFALNRLFSPANKRFFPANKHYNSTTKQISNLV